MGSWRDGPVQSVSQKRAHPARTLALWLSIGLWVVVAVSYWLRPDALAAITAWPVWMWPVPGIGLALIGHTRNRRCAMLAVSALWLVWSMLQAEEPRSLIRALLWKGSQHITVRDSVKLRVVSLNCTGGSLPAAEEVIACCPDIVLLQESPGKEEVKRLARKLFGRDGKAVCGVDTSVLIGRAMQRISSPRELSAFCTGATICVKADRKIGVFSVRLMPPALRTDLWSFRCWSVYATDRRLRREQAMEIARHLARLPSDLPIIVGGDMNVPAGDGSLGPLWPHLRDCFTEAGRGWGNTVLNDFPVLRFDQVWATRNIRVMSVTSRKTFHSDHRMVVCDLLL